MRVWFPNAPSGSVGADQRFEIGVGFSRSLVPPAPIFPPPPVPAPDVDVFIDYYRRYLDDPVMVLAGPTPQQSDSSTPVDPNISYFKRYLNDNQS